MARTLQLRLIPDFDDMRIYKPRRSAGAWPPPAQSAAAGARLAGVPGRGGGESMLIELPDGKQHTHARGRPGARSSTGPRSCAALATAISRSTRPRGWASRASSTSSTIVVAEHADDEAHIKAIAVAGARPRSRKSGRTVSLTQIPSPPGKHPADQIHAAADAAAGRARASSRCC